MNKKRIAYVAGHSGGHIIPALSHAFEYDFDEILIFASKNRLDEKLLKRYKGNNMVPILLPLTRSARGLMGFIFFYIHLVMSFLIAIMWLILRRPKKIISMGGIISVPVCLAGFILNIPFELYELNVEPGKAVKLLSRLASNIYICFNETQKFLPKIQCKKASYPLRYRTNIFFPKKTIYETIQFNPSRTTIFVLGGSQGSQFINQLMLHWFYQFDAKHSIQVIHQTGTSDPYNYSQWYINNDIPALVFSYCDDLSPYYQIADYIIARAGAGTIAEIQFFNKQSLLIPLTTATTNHQYKNAQYASLTNPFIQWVAQDTYGSLFSAINRLIKPHSYHIPKD
jgi:UDP-N-acetylglucosamine--N-acetylmuramyl-(pentapeptide) pyrophosphoryl-undecaprenol N-acetylglucosamine transferase